MLGILLVWIMSLAISLKFKTRIENLYTSMIVVISYGVYLIGLLCGADIGFNYVYIFGVVAFVYVIYKAFKAYDEVKERVFSAGSIGYWIFAAVLAVLNHERFISGSDEFNYWGIALKDIYYGDFAFSGSSNIHPHMTVVWQTFLMKSCGRFEIGIALFAQAIFILSMFMPLFNICKRRIDAFFLGIILFILPLCIFTGTYSTIFNDAFIAVSLGYCIISMIQFFEDESRFRFLQLLTALVALTSSKRIGFILVTLIIAAYVIIEFALNRKSNAFKDLTNSRIHTFKIVGLCLAAIVPIAIWQKNSVLIYILMPVIAAICALVAVFLYQKINEKFNINVKNLAIIVLVMATALCIAILAISITDDWHKLSFNNYIKAVATNSAFGGTIGSIVVITPIAAIAILALITYVCASRCNREYTFIYVSLAGIIIELIYMFLLSYLYLGDILDANNEVGAYLPSYSRYALVFYFAPIMLLLYQWLKKGYVFKFNQYLVSILMICIFLNINNIPNYIVNKTIETKFYGFENAGIELGMDDGIYLVYQVNVYEDGTNIDEVFPFQMYPAYCNIDNSMYYDNIEENGHIGCDKLLEELYNSGCDYVYIQSTDDEFEQDYGEIFGIDAHSGDVYEILRNDNGTIDIVKI